MSSITEQKNTLRKKLHNRVKLLSQQQKQDESALIRERLAAYIKQHIPTGGIIASFANLPSEPALLELHDLLPNHKFAYPKCGADHSMIFYQVSNVATGLAKGAYGIREPYAIATNQVNTQDISLFIIPAFGYTLAGARLGKGGGYYDRALKLSAKNAPFLGVVFSAQILNNAPSEPHDIPVDQVFTGI